MTYYTRRFIQFAEIIVIQIIKSCFILWIIVLVFLISCSENRPILYIYFTGNILSQLSPCGCVLGQTGGVDKLASLILEPERIQNTIFLIAGNSFFPALEVPPELKAYAAFKAGFVYESFCLLSPAAVLIGARDLALGWQFIYQLNSSAKLPLLSSNLTFQDGRFLFNQILVKEIASIRVGIIGLTGKIINCLPSQALHPSTLTNSIFPSGFEIKRVDPVQAAREGLREIRKKRAHFIVLLSDLDEEEEIKVMTNVSGINLVIANNGFFSLGSKSVYGSALIVRPAPRLKSVGQAGVSFKGHRVRLSYESIPLDQRIPPHPRLRQFSQEAGRWLNYFQAELKKLWEEAGVYAGEEKCHSCHRPQVEFWEKTRHAKASNSLAYSKNESNLECVFCHNTVFWGKRFLPNVQCEACHGEAGGHVQNNRVRLSKITNEVCFRCHSPDRFLDFNLEEKIKGVRCPPSVGATAPNSCFE